VRESIKEMLNFQNVNGKVKPYQVKQFIKIIEKHNLLRKEERNTGAALQRTIKRFL